MASPQIVLHGMVLPDGTLQVADKVGLPPGPVQVTVETPTRRPMRDSAWAVLERIWAERKALGLSGRSKEQIDADVQALRSEWDEREKALNHIRLFATTVGSHDEAL